MPSGSPPGYRGLPPLWVHLPSATEDSQRLEALSDGVFAVAMTLLIVDIRVPSLVPHPSFATLAVAVLRLWPHFASYAVSFLVVGLYWVSHHLIFDQVRRSDRGLMWLNMIFLLFVVVIPFSTALLGRYHDNRFAIIFYAANLIFVGLSLQLVWTYASTRHRLIDPALDDQIIRLGTARLLAVPIAGAAAAALTFVSVALGTAMYVLFLIAYSWPGKWTPYWSVKTGSGESAGP